MPDSPPPSHTQIKQEPPTTTQQRLCDFCSKSTALLYCRADTARLCLSCDLQVHSTNPLFTKHTRSLLCDSCHSAPSTIFCSTDHSLVLCQNCDWERHNFSLSSTHPRRPLEGFAGCPSVTELLSVLGFDDVSKKSLIDFDHGSDSISGSDDGFSGYFIWDTPSSVGMSLDDLIVSSGSDEHDHHFQPAMGVPPLPKNRNATCGEHKDELLHQLRELAKLEPNLDDGGERIEPLNEYQALIPQESFQFEDKCTGFQHNSEASLFSSLEASTFQWCNDGGEIADQELPSTQFGSNIETNSLVPDEDSDIGHCSNHDEQSGHPGTTETIKIFPRELNSQERDTAICRYKEKKKARRYDKHIRYESRKVRAESRTRIRGRFAKIDL